MKPNIRIFLIFVSGILMISLCLQIVLSPVELSVVMSVSRDDSIVEVFTADGSQKKNDFSETKKLQSILRKGSATYNFSLSNKVSSLRIDPSWGPNFVDISSISIFKVSWRLKSDFLKDWEPSNFEETSQDLDQIAGNCISDCQFVIKDFEAAKADIFKKTFYFPVLLFLMVLGVLASAKLLK
jgi:hypothetical protein